MESSKRSQAISWWNNLSSLQKTQLCDTNLDILLGVRRWESLTGREIEEIWTKETQSTNIQNSIDLDSWSK